MQVAVVLAAVLVLGCGWVLLADPLPAGAALAVGDLGQLVAAAGAAWCCWLAAPAAGPVRVRWAWRLLAAGCLGWAAGQGVWSYHELSGRAVPFPSLADVGFLAFTVLAAAALLLLPTGLHAATARLRDLLDGLIIAGSLLVLAWATSLGAALSAGGPTRLALLLGLAYPLGDLVVITLVLLVVGRAAAGRRGVLVLLACGLLALAVADSAFVYLSSTGSYSSGKLCDLGWVAGFALVAVAGALAASPAPPVPADQPCVPSWARLALPYLPLLLAESVFAVHLLAGSARPPAAETVLALGLIVLVLTRQFLALADHRRVLLELQSQREHARHQALHDPLTGLANRTLFHDRVEHALALHARATTAATSAATSVLFCDVDDFKTVNDGLGHAAGDALLVELADRLRRCLRPGDTIARLGGDEFAVLIVAARRTPHACRPLVLAGTEVTVSVSVGLASAAALPEGGLDAAELLRRADTAMYAAKGQGKATWVVYDPDRHGQQPATLQLT